MGYQGSFCPEAFPVAITHSYFFKRPVVSEISFTKLSCSIAQLVECQASDILFQVIQRARVQDVSALDIVEPPDGDGLRSGHRPQPVEVSE